MRRTAAAVVALLCVACSPGDGGMSPAPATATAAAAPTIPAGPGIEATAVRLRTDVAAGRRVQVRVTDAGDEPFTVTAVAIDAPGFAPLPATVLTAAFEPGRVIDLPTPYGEPDCAAQPRPAAARLTVSRPGGAVEELRVPLAGDVLDVVHREECAVAGVLAVARVALTETAAAGDSVTGTVVLTRTGDDDRRVTVTVARRSVVFDLAVDGLPLELAPGDDEASAAVTFTSATCEPHVLAETKQPFVFPLSVVLGDAEPVPVPLPVDATQQRLLWDLVQRVC